MPHRRVELARYICEVGQDLLPILRAHGLDATAHCLELAVGSASEIIGNSGGNREPGKPPLKFVHTSQ